MKKIIATLLCLTIAGPCFAAGRFQNQYPDQMMYNNGMQNQRYENQYYGNQRYEEQGYDYHNDIHRHQPPRYGYTSGRTKTIAAVAGISAVALLISALAD